ncbi:hypothetical protein [Portibacter lacus]|uniref:Uncharacterized protein n=1 Tax=Portibacter lacus TaxID=1099794 RepID=A0AA37SJF6_9BACT|nr:hypothetical protein [Portibacter lacus]GLR15661.1 hypothetical protein GCM10007940_02760 [Portibacter lacus]
MDITGADGGEIGDGAQNTIDILNSCGGSDIAAKVCDDYVYDGYDDWFLPTVSTLLEFREHFTTINNKLLENGGEVIADYNQFWSSLESSSFNAVTVIMNPSELFPIESRPKTHSKDVRAVRAF